MATSGRGMGRGKKVQLGLISLSTVGTAIERSLEAVGKISAMSDTGHAILATLIFAFFISYVAADIAHWRHEVLAVWVIGPITILVACYWLIGFLSKHHIPATPFLPVNLYPPDWGYFVMFGWLVLYAVWDIVDAWKHEYEDELSLKVGAGILIASAAVCLFLTLRGPQGS